jgi:hypothetical protein
MTGGTWTYPAPWHTDPKPRPLPLPPKPGPTWPRPKDGTL